MELADADITEGSLHTEDGDATRAMAAAAAAAAAVTPPPPPPAAPLTPPPPAAETAAAASDVGTKGEASGERFAERPVLTDVQFCITRSREHKSVDRVLGILYESNSITGARANTPCTRTSPLPLLLPLLGGVLAVLSLGGRGGLSLLTGWNRMVAAVVGLQRARVGPRATHTRRKRPPLLRRVRGHRSTLRWMRV